MTLVDRSCLHSCCCANHQWPNSRAKRLWRRRRALAEGLPADDSDEDELRYACGPGGDGIDAFGGAMELWGALGGGEVDSDDEFVARVMGDAGDLALAQANYDFGYDL